MWVTWKHTAPEADSVRASSRRLAAIPAHKAAKAERIARIPRTRVPTSAFVFDRSRLGMAALGPGEVLAHVQGDSRAKYANDGLIADTAKTQAVPLVTDDRRLTKRALAMGVEVWAPEQLAARLRALSQRGVADSV